MKTGDPEPVLIQPHWSHRQPLPGAAILSPSAQMLQPQQLAWAAMESVPVASDILEAGAGWAGGRRGVAQLLTFIMQSQGRCVHVRVCV